MKLIYFSPVNWNSFTQRPHEFVGFCRKNLGCEVIWIEPYPTRIPKFSDVKRVENLDRPATRDVPEWLTIVNPKLLPVEPLPFVRALNDWSIKRVIRLLSACTKNDFFVIGKPSLLAKQALNHFNPAVSLYDAMDDFPQFYQGVSSKYMMKLESEIAALVKHISVSSQRLQQKFFSYNPLLILNACSVHKETNYASFQRAFNLKAGYIGTIGNWFDWDLLVALAQHNPGVIFDIIGPVFQPPSIELPSNINMKPAVSHVVAMELMQDFDIGLIPFKCNKLTDSVDPIKYYEYKSFGLSIVSSGFGEMMHRGSESGVYLVDLESSRDIDLRQLNPTDASTVAYWHDRFKPLLNKLFSDY